MNHYHLKILVVACWVFSASLLLAGFLLFSKPSPDERRTFLAACNANNDVAILDLQRDGRAPSGFAELMVREQLPEDINEAIGQEKYKCDQLWDSVTVLRAQRADHRHELQIISVSILGVSVVFALLLFITRDPAKRKIE